MVATQSLQRAQHKRSRLLVASKQTCLFRNRHRAERQLLQCDEKSEDQDFALLARNFSGIQQELMPSRKKCVESRWNTDVTRTYVRGWRLSFHATNVQRRCGKRKADGLHSDSMLSACWHDGSETDMRRRSPTLVRSWKSTRIRARPPHH